MNETSDRSKRPFTPPRGWLNKFRNAGRGFISAFRTQTSLWVQVPIAIAVIVFGVVLKVTQVEFCMLLVCIALVLSLELVNTAIEQMAKVVTSEFNENIKRALDIAAAAVFLASVFAAVVGGVILLPKLLALSGDYQE